MKIYKFRIERSSNAGFFRNLLSKILYIPLRTFIGKSIEQGSATSVYAAIHPSMKDKGGYFLANCKIKENSSAITDETSKKLWELTEKMTKEKYPFKE